MCSTGRRLPTTLSLLSLAWLLAACGDEIVYRDKDPFEQPPANAGEFLGYSDATTKRTTCGNCHSGKQAVWQQTAHADAWDGGAASSAWGATCEACHTVSSLGNMVQEENVGWVATRNPRYQDVQCESCHGPGLTHALNPDVNANKPLASINVSTTLDRGCGQCHSGAHQPFVEEWAASRHSRFVASRATNASCVGCHEPKGVLASWGVRSVYLEEGTNDQMAITCATCHDPHEKKNPAQLRFPIDVPAVEQNLCMKCHYRRAVPEVTSSQGPHSPQGPVLLGEAGWVPPNFTYPTKALVGSHGSDRNPRLCASCHVNSYTVSDELSGAHTFTSTGHSFQATPCVDNNGIPTGETNCDIMQKSFRACVSCHLDETAARGASIVARGRLDGLAQQIEQVLPAPHGTCTANCVPTGEFSTTDNRISTAEGSKFNMQLARERGSHAHNPVLLEVLLLASIQQLRTDYGVQPTVSLDPMLAPPPGR